MSARTLQRAAVRLAKRRRAAFQTARRHTAFVRALRILLPLAVVGLIGGYGFLLFGTLSFRLGNGQLSVAKVEISSEDLKMRGVDYAGVTKDGGRYKVHAREAQVDITQQGPVTLSAIDGEIVQQSGIITRLTSARGILDNKKGEIDLFDGVKIAGSNGLRATMKSAKVFNREHRIVAGEGVEADLPTARIVARTMDLDTKARTGVFTGKVIARLTADQTGRSALGGIAGKQQRAPLDLASERLEFDDTAKQAVFSGGVTAVQGDSQLVAQTLQATYEGRASVPGATPTVPAEGEPSQSRLTKLYAKGQVLITQGADRRIAAETMDANVAADTVQFAGPLVEIQQGKNRMLGRRLFVDRKAGRSRLDAPAEGRTPAGRIKTTFYQAADKAGARAKSPDAAEAAPAGLMQFKTDPNAPMDIEAATLDVVESAKQAIFRTAVRAQQGDFVIQASEVVASYTGETGLMAAPDAAAANTRAPQAQISRVEANENVLITSKDGQEARGKKAVFEAKSNTVVLTGAVQVKQDRTVITGNRLRIDMTTGVAVFENDGTATIGSAWTPVTPAKSAVGPGGLPQVGGLQIPRGPSPGKRQSLTIIPEDLKKMNEERRRGRSVPKSPAAKARSDGWQSTTSPSPVYRAPPASP